MQNERIVLHIDFDSFFASVEQQANPHLRGKPIGVTGSSLSKGVICAASKEAKKFGVKTAMPIFKARQICPQIITVRGDFSKYQYIHEKSLEIFSKYSDLVEPFSIDEAFVEITDTVKFFKSPENVAKKIKDDFYEAFGPYITCSIGIGPNKLIAKLASEYHKPNGMFRVTKENLDSVLLNAKLEDFCGIGTKIHARLNKIGVYNISDLRKINPEILYAEFGNVGSSFLKNLSFGIDNSPVKIFGTKEQPKSVGHQHTLAKNTKDKQEILTNIQRLCDMVGRRLRRNNLVGRKIGLYLRDKDFKSDFGHITLKEPINSTLEIYKKAEEIFEKMNWQKETRLIGVSISLLETEKTMPLYLLPEDTRRSCITRALDKINDKYGEFAIFPAKTLKADRTKGKISSFLKH